MINQTQGPPLEPHTPPPGRLTAKAAGNTPYSTENAELEAEVMQSHRSWEGISDTLFWAQHLVMKLMDRNAGNTKGALKGALGEKWKVP